MPVLPPNEYWESFDQISSGRDGGFEESGERNYVKEFLVITKQKDMGPLAVLSCPGLPIPYFTPYIDKMEADLHALCIRLRARQDGEEDSWYKWIVTAYYSTIMPAGGPPEDYGSPGGPGAPGGKGGGSANNPELEPADIAWEPEVKAEAPPCDLDGKPFMNTALCPFSPAHQEDTAYYCLTFARNELIFTRAKAELYSFAVNSDLFLGAEPGMALCYPPSAKIMYRGKLRYWRVNYKIKFMRKKQKIKVWNVADEKIAANVQDRQQDWQSHLLNAGTMRIQNEAPRKDFGLPIPIMRGIVQVNTPQLLDITGQEVPLVNNVRTPLYIRFRTKESVSFKDLIEKGMG